LSPACNTKVAAMTIRTSPYSDPTAAAGRYPPPRRRHPQMITTALRTND
jgi:hypothetical protein